MTPRVLVVGGHGYFGRLLVEELAAQGGCEIVVADRKARIEPRTAERTGVESFDGSLADASLVICAAGPYQDMPLSLLEACLQRGVPYIDLSDDRGFVRRAREAAAARGGAAPAIAPGFSAAPALSALLARLACRGLEAIDSIDIQIAPGNRAPRGAGTVASLLSSVGRGFTVWRGAAWREVTGWSEPADFRFPQPIGSRRGYLVDVPDHELFPSIFGASRVEFRAGSELAVLNQGVCGLAALSRAGLIRDWRPWAPLLRAAMALFGFLGSCAGAVGVAVAGRQNGRAVVRRSCVVAERGGQRIPVLPAAALARRLGSGQARFSGLVPLDRWLERDALESECASRGYRLIMEEEGG